jgi:hypothetical protein
MASAPYIVTDNKSAGPRPDERRISRQMDSLWRMAQTERDKKLGPNWVQEMKDFHNLDYYSTATQPSYRPRVILPEVQYLLMSESTDLTNDTPKVYINVKGQRDEAREKAFAAQWRLGLFSNRVFDAVLWSQYVNPAWLQVGYDPTARSGKGMVWMRARDPETVFPDPNAKNDHDWSYVGVEDWFYVDEVRRNWPEQGHRVKVGAGYDDYEENETQGSRFDLSMELPPGPLRLDSPEGFEHQRNGPRVRVRMLWVKDYAIETVKDIDGVKSGEALELVVRPQRKWQYPHGRLIVECNGIILADGPNFIPKLPQDDFGTFPLAGVWSLPHLDSLYGPTPVRYAKGPQDIAEKMWTQLIENVIRLNNGVTYIPEESGIDIDSYGGLPGEVHTYRGEKPPTMQWPQPLPQHMTQIPEMMLQKVQRYSGWSPERQGQSGGGNVSPELFDAAVFQGQTLVRMKARMLAETYERISQLVFRMMVRFKTSEDLFNPAQGKSAAAEWKPISDDEECDLQLDAASIRPMSSAMMKSLVLALAKTGMLPPKFIFETLGLPNAEELAEEGEKAASLAALAKLRKPR